MNRRDFAIYAAFGGLAALTMPGTVFKALASGAAEASEIPAVPPPHPLDAHLKDAPQFVMCGDSDHTALGILNLMAREDTMAALKKAGVKHLFIEHPPELQKWADYLAADKILRGDYIREMSEVYVFAFQDKDNGRDVFRLYAYMIQNAEKYGIKTHNVDSDITLCANFSNNPRLLAYNNEFRKALNDKIIDDEKIYKNRNDKRLFSNMDEDQRSDYAKNFSISYFQSQPPDIQKEIYDLCIQERLGSDEQIALEIKKTARAEKSAIFYGIEHGKKFAAVLGEQNVRKIALCGNEKSCAKWENEGWQIVRVGKYDVTSSYVPKDRIPSSYGKASSPPSHNM